MTGRGTALVAGFSGVAGSALARHLAAIGYEVIGIARKPPSYLSPDVRFRSADLVEPVSLRAAGQHLGAVTHVFYTAFANAPGWVAQVAPNAAMLRNLLDCVEDAASGLRHVSLLQGTKYYGAHLGPFRTPIREDDARHFPPSFYYDQQDLLAGRQAGKTWSCSFIRPHTICGYAVGTPLNLIMVLGVYATLGRELGLPLRWPGKPAAFWTVYQTTDADLLARAMTWAATEKRCANEAFNITNGDFIRFEHLWPRLAQHFGMETAAPQQIDLPQFMADKSETWAAIQRKHGLEPVPFTALVDWNYAQYAFSCAWDIMSSTLKARQFGFQDCLDTYDMFIRNLRVLSDRRLIPA
ncbi:SDR family oxidoreductase [Xanthobacter sp. KR7-65]|uniref:SDR family oxidoreductase n=1 Tax=Xanthobacter sp. KR7-65 TaxID=3156612 RepID=UPI0032B48638